MHNISNILHNFSCNQLFSITARLIMAYLKKQVLAKQKDLFELNNVYV